LAGLSLLSELETVVGGLAGAEATGLFTDVDGTLSEISPSPEAARVSAEIAGLLGRLNDALALVAVVSGRRAEEAADLVGRPDLLYLGNHGFERLEDGELAVKPGEPDKIAAARLELEQCLPQAQGLFIEDKGRILAVHYRCCSDENAIARADSVTIEVARNLGLQRQSGRMIFELRPVGTDKGGSILEVAAERGLRQVIYLGDDATDIDAFRILRGAVAEDRLAALTVAVAAAESPPGIKEEADYWVASVSEVTEFLRRLAERYSPSVS